ncbi:MAG TPA: hypothetical protein DDX75_11955 [Phycisphaerales bacterium]|nr:hypothetical protein [Phycisphaerales bacterium]
MKAIFGIIFYLVVVSALNASAIIIPKTSLKPVIDGNLTDAVWEDSKKLELYNSSVGKLINKTEAFVAYDNQNLYLAFKCYESQMDKISKTWNHVEERDNGIWADDCVELFIDPLASKTESVYQFIINSSAVIFDSRHGEVNWDSDIEVSTMYYDKYWTVELSIPLLNFGFVPEGGEMWRMNFGRDEKPAKERSGLSATGRVDETGWYVNPVNFADFQFESKKEKVGISVESLAENGDSKVKLKLKNKKAKKASLEISLNVSSEGKNAYSDVQKIAVDPNSECTISIPYKYASDYYALDLKVSENDRKIYSNQFNIYALVSVSAGKGEASKVWHVTDPLYEELLSDEPLNLAKNGAIYWFVERDFTGMRQFAMQYGFRYSYDEAYQILAANDLLPIGNFHTFGATHYDSMTYDRKHGVKELYSPDWRWAPVPKVGLYPFLMDPVSKKTMMEDLRNALTKYHDVIWAVYIGDELYTYMANEGIDVFAQKKDEYPFIVEVDRQVKEQFGNGKYGIPSSKNGKDPLSWMAYRKWLNREMDKVQAEIYAAVKKDWPDITVISDDPIAAAQPYDFSRWKNNCDIITHQLYPGGSPQRVSFGYVTKLVKDISGTEEFWPCMHVEEYANSFNPQEVLDLISESFRNGATGIHYYLKDTIGVRNESKYMRTEFYGAPDRWQVEMAAIENCKTMRKLNFPEPDFAILFSCDSYSAMPPESRTENAESAYTVLGQRIGSWFKFINDYQIDRNEVDLNKFKAIYIPYARYEGASVVNKIKEYVLNGGTVISGDPEVFAFDTNGTDTSSVRNAIFGVKMVDSCKVKNIQYNGLSLPATGRAFNIETDRDSEVIAAFDNQKPAIVLHKFGKGKAYYFASNPFIYKLLGNKEWTIFFQDLQKKLGLQVDHKIWRFNLPQDLIKPMPQPAGKCLTNNHILWRQFAPLATCNLDTKGSYWYSTAPDEIADCNAEGKIVFENGKLTNRQKAPKAGNVDCGKSKLDDWVVKYTNEKPFEITFDFNDSCDLSRAVIFYSGQMPEVTASTSTDNKNWKVCDNLINKTSFTEDVFDVKLEQISKKARYLKLNFGSRDKGNSLTLAEIEVWTK